MLPCPSTLSTVSVPAEQRGQYLRDRKPQTRPFQRGLRYLFHLIEFFKYPLQMLRADSDAGVLDAKLDGIVAAFEPAARRFLVP